jgi:hypothetical protein
MTSGIEGGQEPTLVIFTCSDDGTVNRIAPLLSVEHLRINLDEPSSWSFTSNVRDWSLTSSGVTVSNSTQSYAWWWKAFLDDFNLDAYIKAEIEYLTHELFHEFVTTGMFVGNDFLHHEYRGKRHYLNSAAKHLRIPNTLLSQNGETTLDTDDVIVKSLASTAFSSKKVLYTTRVDQRRLDFRNPWFLQEFIEAEFDVTIQLVGADLFGFQRRRQPGETVDWRKEQNYSSNVREWQPIELTPEENNQIRSFISAENLDWGRLDLLRTLNGELIFLEFNANGQFGFLDPLNELGLFTAVAKHLSMPPQN